MPVDGEGTAGAAGGARGGPGSASVPAGVSKIVTVDVKGNSPLWMKVKDLAEGVTYRFRIRAKTFAYGPDIEANITTGPGEGKGGGGVRDLGCGRRCGWGQPPSRCCSCPPGPRGSRGDVSPCHQLCSGSPGAPGPPGEPFISRYGSAITIHWSSGDPGQGPITRYVIEARPSGTAAPCAHWGRDGFLGKLRQGISAERGGLAEGLGPGAGHMPAPKVLIKTQGC